MVVTSDVKGGKYRECPIISNVDTIVNWMNEAGVGKVWTYVPDMDLHSYRSEYCTKIYSTLAMLNDFLNDSITVIHYAIIT